MTSNRFANNFDFIRFLAALSVIVTHSYTLSGSSDNDLLGTLTRGLYSFSSLGVDVFFIISGYLIARSIEQSPSLLSYLWKRTLRIFPALIVVVLLCVFILGPLVTNADPKSYFSNRHTYAFLSAISLYYIPDFLPGVFAGNPYPNAVNGSLWTLAYEFSLYIFLAIFFVKKGRIAKLLFILLIFGFFILRGYAVLSSRTFYIDEYHLPNTVINFYYLLNYTVLFGFGAILYFLKDTIPLNGKFFIIGVSVLFISTFKIQIAGVISYIVLPYAVIYLAFLKSKLNKFGKYGDFSYGMYIYAFPVQQTIMYFSGHQKVSTVLLAVLSTLCTLPLAFFSWKFIESKALSLKVKIS